MIENEIQSMIDFETAAWNNQDAESLVSIFHSDMIWPWPQHVHAHNPLEWEFTQGRYKRERWKSGWQKLFDEFELVRNQRETLKITVSKEGDGAFAVVRIDTLWRHRTNGEELHWEGIVGKGYTKVSSDWKLIMHVGVLQY